MSRRVLLIGEFGSLNGGENSFLAIATHLQKSGWTFQAAVPPRSDFSSALESLSIETIPFSTFDDGGQRKSQSQVRDDLSTIIRQCSPDLIHCNSLSVSRLVGPIADQLQIPSLGYLRDILKLSKKAIADINQLDRLIAVSAATKKWHCEQGIDSNKTFVIHNGVDPTVFYPTEEKGVVSPSASSIRTELSIDKESPVLLFVGQIGMRKGVDILVEAFIDVATSFPDSHLLVVGQRHSKKKEATEFEQRVMQQGHDSQFHSHIHWLGTRSDVAAIMREATILVHPARQEPLGRVLLEAAASGLPIVSTNVGGSSEILKGHESLLVSPDAADQVSDIVLQLLRDRSLLKSIGESLRKIAIDSFSPERCSAQVESHYQELASN